jgi:gluconate 2-dehydrogenase gamma chain
VISDGAALIGGFSMSEKKQETDSSRRKFLRNSGIAVGGIVVGSTIGGLLGNTNTEPEVQTETEQIPPANPNVALMFFYPDEYVTTVAACERIFPEDDLGPGAGELNAAIYIDHQLASQWGINGSDYRMGPWYEPAETQGEQVRLFRKDLFRSGLKELDHYSNTTFDNDFVNLEPSQQDEVLVAFEAGEANDLSGVSSTEFFNLLRTLTIEGVYADPMYGGNNEMEGWAMRKYPGTRMEYNEEVNSKEFIELKPENLNSHMGH